MYAIFIPRTQLTSILEGQPPQNKALSKQNKGHHLGSRYTYIFDIKKSTESHCHTIPCGGSQTLKWQLRHGPAIFFGGAKTWHSSYRTTGGQGPNHLMCFTSQVGKGEQLEAVTLPKSHGSGNESSLRVKVQLKKVSWIFVSLQNFYQHLQVGVAKMVAC